MRYDVIMEPSAVSDLRDIVDYIARALQEPATAARIYHSIKEHLITLAEMPKRHSVLDVEPYMTIGVRALPVKNYIAYYVVDDERGEVHVLRVLYHRRNWQNII